MFIKQLCNAVESKGSACVVKLTWFEILAPLLLSCLALGKQLKRVSELILLFLIAKAIIIKRLCFSEEWSQSSKEAGAAGVE